MTFVPNGVQSWYDNWEILPGDSLTHKIGESILDNDFFVVVLSPNSVDSEWVQRELDLALNKEFRERQVQVIPVLLRDCEVPPFLRDKVYADFRQDYHNGLVKLLRAVGHPLVSRHVASTPWVRVEPSQVTARIKPSRVTGNGVTHIQPTKIREVSDGR